MRIRLTAGSNLSPTSWDGVLQPLYHSSSLLIEGTADLCLFTTSKGTKVFFAGHLAGFKSPIEILKGFSLEAPIETWLSLLEGRFLLALVFADGSALITADCFGKKDAYYRECEGKTVVASDLDLLPQKGDEKGYDPASLAHVLCVYGYRAPKRHTLYLGIRRLGVGEWLQIQNGKTSVKEIHFQPLSVEDYGEQQLSQYADLLLEAVAKRGSPEGNVVYLSSGWDSTALLACLVKLYGPKKVRGVIGRMQYAGRSGVVNQFEIDRAKAVADYYKVSLDVVEFDYRTKAREMLEPWIGLFRSLECPSLTALNVALLSNHVKQTARGNEVLFAGEISDGAHNLGFSQFTTIFHPVLAFREYSDKMASYLFGPTFLKFFENGTFSKDSIYQLLRGRCGDVLFDEPGKDDYSRRKQLLAGFFLRANRMPLWSLSNNSLLTESGRHAYSEEMESVYLNRAASELTPETLYSWYLQLYNSFHWQGATVAPMAATAEVNGFKMELPFWDGPLQSYLARMPESWGRGLDLNPTKYPLKWMLKNRIDYPLHLQVGPHSYLYDVDPSFSHAAEILYGSSFAPLFKTVLQKKAYQGLLDPSYFDLKYVDQMVGRYLSGTEARGAEMNSLLALCFLSTVGWY